MVGCLPALSFSGLREAVLQLGASTLQRRICFIKVVVVRAKCIWLGFRTVQSFKRFSLFIFLINAVTRQRMEEVEQDTGEASLQLMFKDSRNRKQSVLMVCNLGVNFSENSVCWLAKF